METCLNGVESCVQRSDALLYIAGVGIGGRFDMSFDEAMELISRDDAFKATVYAMNTLLIHKGIYSQQEFEKLFVEWVKKEESKKRPTARRASRSQAALV